ncbi:MAG: beta-galactosidase BgaS [Nitrososphaerota archaeon]|nr:beta-galactosidase BgaS [Candidatus Bathyarchaeota archaeon]MDW8193526.1 beta-galactosidase BgaS [Nitrososphaerota archaeon]
MVSTHRFLWGVSSSGFQFEMGDPGGEGLDPNTDWYLWVHDMDNICKGVVSGDFPENGVSYWSLYGRDHDLAVDLGLNAYRIGVEWSRIFPKSTISFDVAVERSDEGLALNVDVDDKLLERLDGVANKEALNHYRSIIADLRHKGLKVFVCLNHFTLPLWIHNPIITHKTALRRGPKGWLEETTIIEFTKYAAYLAWKLGDIVDYWATINEPMAVAEAGYMFPQSGFPPAVNNFRAFKRVAVNLAVAHARAYDAIKAHDTVRADEDSPSPAYVGLIHNVIPVHPQNKVSKLDMMAAKFMDDMHNQFFPRVAAEGWLDHNLNGVRDKGEVKGFLGQRLDWLGVNYYTRFVVRGKRSMLAKLFAGIQATPELMLNYGVACKPNGTSADGKPASDMGWEIYPEGLMESLGAMANYKRPLYVTENGIADEGDKHRPKFINEHIKVLEKARKEGGIDVRGYFHWALTDNYEWAKGFKMKFGLYAVDLENKRRRARRSAKLYRKIIEENE